jgi:hypothetical protein
MFILQEEFLLNLYFALDSFIVSNSVYIKLLYFFPLKGEIMLMKVLEVVFYLSSLLANAHFLGVALDRTSRLSVELLTDIALSI